MSTQVTVKFIANGYTVNWSGSQAIGVPASLYAAVIPEVVYWLGRIFDPISTGGAQAAPDDSNPTPGTFDGTDPRLNQLAMVEDIASGGFIVRKMPNPVGGGVQMVDAYATNMDAVADLLDLIFAPIP